MLTAIAYKLVFAVAFIALASYFDLRQRRVPNALTLPVIAIGVAANAYSNAGQEYYFALFFAFAFSYVLYRLGAWAGGDAKFFTALFAIHSFGAFSFIGIFLGAALLLVPVLVALHAREFLAMRGRVLSALAASVRNALIAGLLSVPFAYAVGAAVPESILLAIASAFLASFLLKVFLLARASILGETVRVEELKQGMVLDGRIYVRAGKVSIWLPPTAKELITIAMQKGIEGIRGRMAVKGIALASGSATGLSAAEIAAIRKAGMRKARIRESLPFVPVLGAGYLLYSALAGWFV